MSAGAAAVWPPPAFQFTAVPERRDVAPRRMSPTRRRHALSDITLQHSAAAPAAERESLKRDRRLRRHGSAQQTYPLLGPMPPLQQQVPSLSNGAMDAFNMKSLFSALDESPEVDAPPRRRRRPLPQQPDKENVFPPQQFGTFLQPFSFAAPVGPAAAAAACGQTSDPSTIPARRFGASPKTGSRTRWSGAAMLVPPPPLASPSPPPLHQHGSPTQGVPRPRLATGWSPPFVFQQQPQQPLMAVARNVLSSPPMPSVMLASPPVPQLPVHRKDLSPPAPADMQSTMVLGATPPGIHPGSASATAGNATTPQWHKAGGSGGDDTGPTPSPWWHPDRLSLHAAISPDPPAALRDRRLSPTLAQQYLPFNDRMVSGVLCDGTPSPVPAQGVPMAAAPAAGAGVQCSDSGCGVSPPNNFAAATYHGGGRISRGELCTEPTEPQCGGVPARRSGAQTRQEALDAHVVMDDTEIDTTEMVSEEVDPEADARADAALPTATSPPAATQGSADEVATAAGLAADIGTGQPFDDDWGADSSAHFMLDATMN